MLGHSSPFSFKQKYEPSAGIDKMQIGTPPIIASNALEAALDIFENVNISEVRAKTIELSELFINQTRKNCPELKLISPISPRERGAHVAYAFQNGYAVIQCLIKNGVIGDFRMPNLMRFGFNPLFNDKNDVLKASKILVDVIQNNKWNKPEFKRKLYVT